MRAAVENGGTKLDSYSGNHGFYIKCGFEPVSWCKWDDNYAPDGWDSKRDGREDIIFYKYTGKEFSGGRRKVEENLNEFKNNVPASKDYDSAQKIRDNSIGD